MFNKLCNKFKTVLKLFGLRSICTFNNYSENLKIFLYAYYIYQYLMLEIKMD